MAEIALTDSQRDQLRAFLEEQGASEERVSLQAAQTLPSSYIEAVLLNDGEPTNAKRIRGHLDPPRVQSVALTRHARLE